MDHVAWAGLNVVLDPEPNCQRMDQTRIAGIQVEGHLVKPPKATELVFKLSLGDIWP